MSSKKQWQNSKLTVLVLKIRDLVFYDALGGPKVIRMRYIINAFKGLTFLYVLFIMQYFQNFSNAIKLYFFVHGSYGFFWVFKDFFFPDERFFAKQTIASNAIMTIFLLLYWMIPLPLAIGWSNYDLSLSRSIFIVSVYLVGLVLMMGSDYQKNTVLKQKKGLINNGFFKITRNPNYLGEVLIYLSFAICAKHWIGYAIDLFAWFVLFNIQMYLKDKISYELKQGWQEYYSRTYRFFPKIFQSHMLNLLTYMFLIGLFCILQFKEFFSFSESL